MAGTSEKVKLRVDFNNILNSHIAYGQVDNTSTSTVFTATVPNVNQLTDGTTVMLKNGIVTSAEGFTLNVNNLGAKPVYSNLANATRDTTIFNINYTMLFVYDSSRVNDGCWICYRGYDSNTNTIGYQLRTNSTKYVATDKGYRYRLWLQTSNDGKFMPVNLSTSTDATSNRSNNMNTREFLIGGDIRYNATNGTVNANAEMSATTLWQQYTLSLGYSFNNTGSALTLTASKPLYMVAIPTGGGNARLTSPYYTQSLPSSNDGKIYILLGYMYSATSMELVLEHPVFEYRDGSVGLYNPSYTISDVDDLLDSKSDINHTHTVSNITDFPTVPTKTSDLTNDSGYLTSHQDITGKEDKSNKVANWSSTVTDTNYPTEKLVKNSLDNKASSTDLTNGLQNIGGYTIHTVYNVSGTASAFNISEGLIYAQQTPVFFLVKNTIGDNEANATMKYYPNGNNITIIDTYSNTSNSPIQQGVWKKNTWALFFCAGNNTVQLRYVFYDGIDIGRIINILGIEILPYYIVSSVSKDTKRVTYNVNDTAILNGNAFYLKVPYYETSTDVKVVINNSSTPIKQGSDYVTESQVNGHLLKLRFNNGVFEVLEIYDYDKLIPSFSDLSSVATSGSYNDLSNKPTIPTDVSDLTDTQNTQFTPKSHTHTKSNITDFPTIPSKVSDLNNDSGFITSSSLPTKTSDLQNDGDGTNAFLTQHQSLTNYLQKTDVVNNLTSTDTDKPLSARQGKLLNDLIGQAIMYINQ